MASNAWCSALGIETPRLGAVKDHRGANVFSLLLVTLLEKGEPMTLVEVAARFEEAGIAGADSALASLKRCKPGRPPVYRDGDHYHLDPHDAELDLWAFRLGLRPPKIPHLKVVRPEPEPLPPPDAALAVRELDLAWKDASLNNWSAVRVALAILDANRGPMFPDEVVAFVARRTRWHALRPDSAKFAHRGSPIEVLANGRWAIAAGADDSLRSARRAVRARLEQAQRYATMRPDETVMAANRKAIERQRAAHAADLARMTRVLLTAFPAKAPQAVALVDVGTRAIETFVGDELSAVPGRLAEFDIIGAVDVRALVRELGFAPGERRLAELGPPQKSRQLNQRGRTLRLTTELLVQGSCGISKPFGDAAKLAGYLASGQLGKLRQRLEADVKSLFALYEYGRLHGAVRLRWGFLDERIPAPWVHRDEPWLHSLKQEAFDNGISLEVVAGRAPGWNDPWAAVQMARVFKDGWHLLLADDHGYHLPDLEVQLARLALPHLGPHKS